MKWTFKNIDEIKYNKLKKIEGMTDTLAKVLSTRDESCDFINNIMNNPVDCFIDLKKDYLNNDDLNKVAEKIKEYINKDKAEIWVFADYDVDGLTSGYTITDFIRKVTNNKVYVYYPDKKDGYGLSINFCNALVDYKKTNNIDDKQILVVTVDNGITCNTQVDILNKNGIEIVITDHHQPKETLPSCNIYDPHTQNSTDNGKELAGCGVAFMIINKIEELMGYDEFSICGHYLPYVAIGTIADMVPLTGVNPYLIRLGFNAITYDMNNEFIALKTWKDKLGIKGNTFLMRDIGWTIAPRLNSCGRLNNITKGAEMMFATEEEETEIFAQEIEAINRERKKYTDYAMEMASKIDYTDKSICIFSVENDMPIGMAGVIANKLKDFYNKPAFVYGKCSDGTYVGSARSIEGLPLPELFNHELAKKNITFWGGHVYACGFSFTENTKEKLFDSIDTSVRSANWLIEDTVEEEIKIDSTIELKDINADNYEMLNSYVFGDEPIVQIHKCKVLKTQLSKNNPNNIRFFIQENNNKKNIWAWGMADKYKEIGEPSFIDMAGNLSYFGGDYTLNVIDFKASDSE